MPGTRIGGLKAARTTKKRHGKNFYRIIGSHGGKAGDGSKKGFASSRERAIEAGRKGGLKTKEEYYKNW